MGLFVLTHLGAQPDARIRSVTQSRSDHYLFLPPCRPRRGADNGVVTRTMTHCCALAQLVIVRSRPLRAPQGKRVRLVLASARHTSPNGRNEAVARATYFIKPFAAQGERRSCTSIQSHHDFKSSAASGPYCGGSG